MVTLLYLSITHVCDYDNCINTVPPMFARVSCIKRIRILPVLTASLTSPLIDIKYRYKTDTRTLIMLMIL